MLLAQFIVSAGYFLAVRRWTSLPDGTIPFFVVNGIIIVLYLGALVGGLSSLVAGIVLFGLVEFTEACYRRELPRFTSVPFVIFFGLSFLLLLPLRHAHYTFWDEFTHWGLELKYLALCHHLPDVHAVMGFKDYPPAVSLFRYLVLALRHCA